MDEAYRQHANPARRRNCSSANLNHLSLAPMTSRLPFSDEEEQQFEDPRYLTVSRSYLEGRSAPTTPGLLSRSPAHPRTPVHPSAAAATSLPKKSLSATALHSMDSRQTKATITRRGGSGTQTPTRHYHHKLAMTAPEQHSPTSNRDWLEHTGAFLSESTRHAKGQAWLASRDSSTSLTGNGRHGEERDWNAEPSQSRKSSASNSRAGSRVGSRVASRVMTPQDRHPEGGYFVGVDTNQQGPGEIEDEWASGPNFINLDDTLEASGITRLNLEADEAVIRNLVRTGNTGVSSWIGGLVGWPLFSVDEEVTEEDDAESYLDAGEVSQSGSHVRFQEVGVVGNVAAAEEHLPPPSKDDGAWRDAAWLFGVASRVLV